MKSRPLMCLVVALITNATSLGIANAQSVTTLDPSAFAPGTNVTDAFAGVTLSAFSLLRQNPLDDVPQWVPSYAPVYSAAANSQVGPGFSSSSTSLFSWGAMWGALDGSCFSECSHLNSSGGSLSNSTQLNSFGTNLLVSFAAPVNSVSILDSGNFENGVFMEAFDASNQMVGFCAPTAGVIQPLGNYGCYSVLSNPFVVGEGDYELETSISASTSGGISKVLIGGYNEGYSMSTIQYTTRAPEIDPASAASGVSLLLGVLLVLRGRRPMEAK
jgi:hypothetical protein